MSRFLRIGLLGAALTAIPLFMPQASEASGGVRVRVGPVAACVTTPIWSPGCTVYRPVYWHGHHYHVVHYRHIHCR